MVMHSLSKVRKWGSQRSPGIAFGWATRCHVWRAARACVRDPSHICVTYCFRDALSRRGACTALVLHLSPLSRRPFSHSPSSICVFVVSRVGVIVLQCIPRQLRRLSYSAPGHGRKRYYFSQFAKQMLPIVKPPAWYGWLCCSHGRVYFAGSSPTDAWHRDILPPLAWRNKFFLRANPCNREIFIPVHEKICEKEKERGRRGRREGEKKEREREYA